MNRGILARISLALLLGLGLAASLDAQETAPAKAVLDSIPESVRNAVSSRRSYVIAFEGESYLFNPSANVLRAPFLKNVHRAFGFSNDDRYFLYLKSNGRFPTLQLCVLDLLHGDESVIAERVFFASWSRSSLSAAYLASGRGRDTVLSVYDVGSKSSSQVAAGMLAPDMVEWSSDGQSLRYVVRTPLSEDYFHDQRYSYETHEYQVKGVRSEARKEAPTASRTLFARDVAERLALKSPAEEETRSAVSVRGFVYASVRSRGKLVVKRFDPSSAAVETMGPGDLYAVTDDGVVLREYQRSGVTYTFVPHQSGQAGWTMGFTGHWNLPYAGSAYLVQGGSLFTGPTCDGSACLVVGHKNTLGFALDFQQTPEDGQGDQRILAAADGTVVSVTNDVTCNNISTTCSVGWDDFSSTCNSNGGAGNSVVIAHPDGSYSMYGHLRSGSIPVLPGQTVAQGQFIAIQGHTGSAKSPTNYRQCGDHLHFQRQNTPLIFDQSIPTDFDEMACTPSCMAAYISNNAEPDVAFAPSLALRFAPSTISSGVSTTTLGNRVILDAPAGPTGEAVTFTTSDASRAAAPAPVTVPPGANSALFSVTANPGASASQVTITATTPTATASSDLTLAPPALNWFQPASQRVGGGTVINGNEVMITGAAPATGVPIAVSSSDPAVASVPSGVVVPPGAASVTFPVTTYPVTATATANVTVDSGTVSFTKTYTVDPVAPLSVALSPNTVLGGATTTANVVNLNAPGPVGGGTITLSSSDPSVASVAASTIVQFGQTVSDPFGITTSPVAVSTSVTISATYNGTTITRNLAVNPISVFNLFVIPNTVTGGIQTTANRLTLSGPAPAGGAVVSIASDNPAAVPQTTVVVPAGSTNSPNFTIGTSAVNVITRATISATYNGLSRTATLNINPPVLSSITLGSPSVGGGGSVLGNKVSLTGPAPTGDVVVNLASSNPGTASVPASVTVPAGSADSPDFVIITTPVTSSTPVVITATSGLVTKTASLTVNPINVSSVSVSPSPVLAGTTATVVVTVSVPAPGGGLTVALSSSDPTAAAVPANVNIPAGSTASGPVTITTSAVPGPTSVTITASYQTSSQSAILSVTPLALVSATLTPQTVPGGNSSIGIVTLAGPAPAGGMLLSLTSSNPAVATVPATVNVPAGATSSPGFTVSTVPVAASSSVTITVSFGSESIAAALVVNSPPVAGLILNPRTVGGGQPTVQNAVTTSQPAPATGVTVSLTSSNPTVATVPATVTVPAGTTRSPNFQITTTDVPSSTPVTISATAGGVTVTNVLTVNPTAVAAITLTPNKVVGGASTAQNKVTLDSPAPLGGATVLLTSSDPALAVVPATIQVPEFSRFSPIFTINTSPVAVSTSVTVSAAYGGVTRSASLTVDPIGVTALTLNPMTVAAGATSTLNTVTLNSPAPAGGAVVNLTSSDPAIASVPASVTVPQGATVSPAFTITTGASPGASATITAAYNGTTVSGVLTVGSLTMSSVSVSPASVVGGATLSVNSVSLNGPAPTGGVSVALTSSDPAVASVPSSVTVLQGSTSAPFSIVTSSVSAATTVMISASYGGVTRSASLTVNPLRVVILFLNPQTFGGGRTTTDNKVTLNGPAPAGGAVVTLTSSNPSMAQVPSSITVPASTTTSPKFNIVSSPTASTIVVTITATYNGGSLARNLTINPTAIAQIQANPSTVVGGNSTGSNKAILDSPAPPGGAVVMVMSSNPAVAQPPISTTVASSATSGPAFAIPTSPVSAPTAVTISGTYGGVTKTATLTVNPPSPSSVSLSPSIVTGGSPATGTVTLNGPGPTGGWLVTLGSSSSTVASPPATVVVPDGATSVTFPITTSAVPSTQAVTISATANGVTRTAVLTVN